MATQTTIPAGNQVANRLFEQELGRVREEMLEPVLALEGPLRELILARVEAAGPPYRGALVLSAGYSDTNNSDMPRINLAAALEMLEIALGIHEQLLYASRNAEIADPAPEQRTHMGGSILAGDFCFSCSAQLAARTDSPAVVATFATALQTVSEIRLRRLLPENDDTSPSIFPSTDQVIMRSGITAALELSDLNEHDRATIDETAGTIVNSIRAQPVVGSIWIEDIATLPQSHWRRWLAFVQWLDDLRGGVGASR